ncbi:MAG: GumC family protein [Adhaeribacter sp.]
MSSTSSQPEDNLFIFLVNKYLPFWPLFAGLLALALLGAWAYLHFLAVPTYEASATIIVKDYKKGVEESRMMRSMDAFISNTTVENEIKVIQSRPALNQVVKALRLYAPVYEKGPYKSTLAYTTSPIQITLRAPEQAREAKEVFFTYSPARQAVQLGGRQYPLNQWVQTPYGELQFSRNPRQQQQASAPLYFNLADLKTAAGRLGRRLSVQSENKLSTAVTLRLQDPAPERAEDILNHLVEAYNQVGVENKKKLAASTLAFVENRIRLVGQELESLEKQVMRYKTTQGVVDLSEQGKLFLAHAGENERELADIHLQLSVLDQVERFSRAAGNQPDQVPATAGLKDGALSQLVQRLYDAKIQYQQTRQTTGEQNPILLALRDEITGLRQQLLEQVKNQRLALQASQATLKNTKNHYASAIQSLPQKEKELLEISRQQASKKEAYRFLLEKREEAQLSLAPSAEDSNFSDQAEASLLPVSPQPTYLYFLAAVGALAAGLAFVTGRELLTNKLLFRAEIQEATPVPIVGELSQVKRRREEVFRKPEEAFVVEQFRKLRVTLGLYGRFFLKKKILVTSSIPGEGKSFVSTHLAYSLAGSGKKTGLLDFDLRHPHTSRLFGLHHQPGITEFLSQAAAMEDIIYPTEFGHLYLVPAGLQVGDQTELLLNGQLEAFFAYLENEFDYLIIDTPPVDLVSDAYLLSEYCDISLLVMRHGYTPKKIVQQLNQNKKLQHLRQLAIVFNGVKARGFMKKHYGYGYGYGHENNYGTRAYVSGPVQTKSQAS